MAVALSHTCVPADMFPVDFALPTLPCAFLQLRLLSSALSPTVHAAHYLRPLLPDQFAGPHADHIVPSEMSAAQLGRATRVTQMQSGHWLVKPGAGLASLFHTTLQTLGRLPPATSVAAVTAVSSVLCPHRPITARAGPSEPLPDNQAHTHLITFHTAAQQAPSAHSDPIIMPH